MKNLIVCLLMMGVYHLQGQDLLVTKKGEKVEGKITFDFSPNGYENATVKSKEGKSSYKSYLVDYLILGEDTLDVLAIDNESKFALRLTKGTSLSYYRIQRESNYDFDVEIVYKADGSYIEESNIGFKNRLSKFLEDCNEVSKSIKGGTLKTSKMEDIIDAYDNCGTTATAPIIASSSSIPADLAYDIAPVKTYVGLLNQLIAQVEAGKPVSPELISAIEIYRNSESIDTLIQELKGQD